MLCHRLAQIRYAIHGRVLVQAVAQVVHARLDHVVRPVPIGKALPEIDRIIFLGEA